MDTLIQDNIIQDHLNVYRSNIAVEDQFLSLQTACQDSSSSCISQPTSVSASTCSIHSFPYPVPNPNPKPSSSPLGIYRVSTSSQMSTRTNSVSSSDSDRHAMFAFKLGPMTILPLSHRSYHGDSQPKKVKNLTWIMYYSGVIVLTTAIYCSICAINCCRCTVCNA